MATLRTGLWLLALAGAASALAPARAESPVCADVTRGADDAVEALRREEASAWHAALRAGRAGRKAMSRSLAAGPGAAGRIAAEMEAANHRYFEAVERARTLCRCRLERGAAEPEECERKYPSR